MLTNQSEDSIENVDQSEDSIEKIDQSEHCIENIDQSEGSIHLYALLTSSLLQALLTPSCSQGS